MEKEAIEMSDINSPVKHVHSMSSKDHENVTEDVVIKVKSGVASQLHEGAADVHIQHVQMHNVYGNGFNTGIKNLFPDISDDEIGNDDEKMVYMLNLKLSKVLQPLILTMLSMTNDNARDCKAN